METDVLAVEIAKLELGPGDAVICMLKGTDINYSRAREFSDALYKVLGHHRFLILNSNAVELKVAKYPGADHVQD